MRGPTVFLGFKLLDVILASTAITLVICAGAPVLQQHIDGAEERTAEIEFQESPFEEDNEHAGVFGDRHVDPETTDLFNGSGVTDGLPRSQRRGPAPTRAREYRPRDR